MIFEFLNAKIRKENDFHKQFSFFVYSKIINMRYLSLQRYTIQPIFPNAVHLQTKTLRFLTYVFRWVIFGVIRKLDMSGDTEKILFILLFIVIQ